MLKKKKKNPNRLGKKGNLEEGKGKSESSRNRENGMGVHLNRE